MKKYQSVNTFSRVPSPAQICSYIVVILQSCIFYIMVRPNIQSQLSQLILTILFSVSLSLLLITTFICSFIDPTDSVILQYKSGSKNKSKLKVAQLLYCDYCQSYVTPSARHCRQCDRCVQNFDHHCMWINNCVGSKNYNVFIAMIISTCFNLTIYLAAVIVLSIQKQWNQFLGFIITCWIVMGIVGILWVLLLNLNLLHIYLMCKGYTTYQFIMARRQEDRQKQFQNVQKQAKQRQAKLKATVQNSKKRLPSSKLTNQRQQASQHHLVNNTKIQNFQKTPSRKNRKSTQSNGSGQQTNARIKFNGAQQSTKVKVNNNSQAIQFKKLEQINNQPNQNNQNNIFSKPEISSQYRNSEVHSIKIGDINDQKLQGLASNFGQGPGQQQKVYSSEEDDASSIKISQFFTKNKSFNLLISNQQAEKPHKKLQNLSYHRAKTPLIKQKTIQGLPDKGAKSRTSRQNAIKVEVVPYINNKDKQKSNKKNLGS